MFLEKKLYWNRGVYRNYALGIRITEGGEKIWTQFQASQLVKNPPAMWETWVWSLGWEDPLEKGKATHSSIMALRILRTI